MMQVRTGQSNTSSVTDTSMGSRMSVIEQHIASMETSITHSLEKAIAEIIRTKCDSTTTSIETQPPGGELAGRDNE